MRQFMTSNSNIFKKIIVLLQKLIYNVNIILFFFVIVIIIALLPFVVLVAVNVDCVDDVIAIGYHRKNFDQP